MLHPPFLYGFHCPGGEFLMQDAGTPGWIVFTHDLGHDPSHHGSFDYSRWTSHGLGAIARLNNGYGDNGTIPLPHQYNQFAHRVRNWVEESVGCDIWVIGNEMNHGQERPHGEPITPEMYARCFTACERMIHSIAGHENDQVVPGAVAPWNNTTSYDGNPLGDWVVYFLDLLAEIAELGGTVGAINLHTYTHGHMPYLVDSDAKMNAPFQDRHFHFNAYKDFLNALPGQYRDLPVYITETDQDVPWRNENTGWVQRAYANVDAWNMTPGNQQVRALVLYRWTHDKWEILPKGGVHEDFQAAMQHRYRWGVKPVEPALVQGFQIVTYKAVNVRESPGYAPRVGQVGYEALVFVKGDPVVKNGLAWWPIRTRGIEGKVIDGWMADTTHFGLRLLAPVEMGESWLRLLPKPFLGDLSPSQAFGSNPAFYKRWSYGGVPLKGHNGIDWPTFEGTELYAVDEGRVKASGYDKSGFGNYVVISHAWGETLYAHLSKRGVVVNQRVEVREAIGLSGNTGMSTGPHLHFGVRVAPFRRADGWGGYCDPAPLMEG